MICEEEKIRWQTNAATKSLTTNNWAIYGTGDVADIVIDELKQSNLIQNVKYIIDREPNDKTYNNYRVQLIENVYKEIDVILVAAKIHHRTIYERICKFLKQQGNSKIEIIDIVAYNSDKSICNYVRNIEQNVLKKNDGFVNFNSNGYERGNSDTKIIAWYLPQFHQIEINNKYHGQGFTEWTNTSQMFPLFVGHNQPHIPYDVGYYDLMNIDTMKRQIFLAKHYGICGFAFHYYWFSGQRVMEKPLELFLRNKNLDMPFCLSWATENWTTLWDGGDNSIIYEQGLSPADYEKFFCDIFPLLNDDRYIKISNKPILIIYRCTKFPIKNFQEFIKFLRKKIKEKGFPDFYIMLANCYAPKTGTAEDWGGDAMVEYQPHMIGDNAKLVRPAGYLNPNYVGTIEDMSEYISNKMYMMKHRSKQIFRSALTSWDNTARKCLTGGRVFVGLTPQTYKTWLIDIMRESKQIHNKDEDIVFVNSWNEWAEGSHLEPDIKYGYAYLEATRQSLEEMSKCRKH